MDSTILIALFAVPGIGGLICLGVGERASRWTALVFSLVGFGLGAALYFGFDDAAAAQLQMVFSRDWIPGWGIRFALGVDGLSVLPVLAMKLLTPLAILSSFGETKNARYLFACYLLLDACVTGAFLATDLVLFYVFFEALLIPMTLIVGVWGGEDRIEAATKYFLLTFSCSLCMLLSILVVLAIQSRTGTPTGDIATLYRLSFPSGVFAAGLSIQEWIVLGFTIAFLVKIPIFPLHTWLPYAQGEAPVGGAAILAAVLFQLGTYGILRFSVPLGPEAFFRFVPALAVLSLVGIIYGAWLAYQQQDLKRLIAYSTLSHLSYLVLGICAGNAEGLSGALIHAFNHGLSGATLFLLAGMLQQRRKTTHFDDFGGLAETMPAFAAVLVIASLSSIAVPGLNGFVGEFLILLGAMQREMWWGAVALLGSILGAAFILLLLKKILFGKTRAAENKQLKDLQPIEWAIVAPCLVLIVVLGVKPKLLLDKVDAAVAVYWSSWKPAVAAKTSFGATSPVEISR